MSMYEIVEEETSLPQVMGEEIRQEHNNVNCIVLLTDSIKSEEGVNGKPLGAVLGIKSYNLPICGANMCDWVARSCPTPAALVHYSENNNLLDTIKPLLKDGEYTLVLYSDTPLVTARDVDKILDYVAERGLAVCKLARGWVFKTEYLKRAEVIYATTTYDVCKYALRQIVTTQDYKQAIEILQKRIIDYHLDAGVQIADANNTYIECNVAISSGATIEPFVSLTGKSVLGACKVGAYSKINNSTIGDSTIVKNYCYINQSVIKNNCIISDRANVVNKSVVSDDCIVKANSLLCECAVSDSCTIGAGCTLLSTLIAKGATIGATSTCTGDEGKSVKIGSNATLAEGCKVFAGAYVKAGTMTRPGSVIVASEQ